ncbi:MAG: caspase family protein, partial [Caldilineaceae bacterium]
MPQLFALLIGINTYAPDSRVPPLQGCANDVLALRQTLLRRAILPESHLRTLVNEQASRTAVIGAWREHLRDKVAPGDTAWIHFSGHGSRARSRDPSEHDGYDETLVLWDSRLPGGWDLLDKEVAVLIAEVEAKGAQVMLFLDCCHAGGATRADRSSLEPAVRACLPDARPRAPGTLLGRATRGETASSSALLVAACLETQKAREHAQPVQSDLGAPIWHGALTWCFLRLLEREPVAQPWARLFPILAAQVRSLYPQQTPQLTGPIDLPLFGGAASGALSSPTLRLLEVRTGEHATTQMRVDGGAALGILAGARLQVDDGARPLAATVLSTTVADAWAALDSPPEAPLTPGAPVTLLAYGGEEAAAGVLAAPAALRAHLRAGGSPLLRLARTQTAQFRVPRQPAGSGQSICDAGGEPLVWLLPAASE